LAALVVLVVLVAAGGAGAALALVASGKSSHGGHRTHSANGTSTVITENEVQTASVAATKAKVQTGSGGSATSAKGSSGARAPEGGTPTPNFESYEGPGYTAQIPSGWVSVENGVQKQGYQESKWQNPAAHEDYVLIDSSQQSAHSSFHPESPAEEAAPVHRDLEKEAGYEELSYSTVELAGTPTQEWVFRVPGNERVDYFFQKCTGGFAVLGSTTPARFPRLAGTFKALAQSVEASCE
jgi:hypothetical protein